LEGPHTNSPKPPDGTAGPFVVGLGASAGGIDALKTFFTHVAPDSGAAYVVILHLSPDHDSRLAEVLQTNARIPVTQVRERVTIEPNHVYVVPPNKSLSIDRHSIVVSDVTRREQRRSPVDLFFRSLADAQGAHSACVVLSGTGPNGSAGLKRVKEYGGLAIAQDPDEAEYDEMPRNAIATGLVDVVLPVADIPRRIQEYHDRCRAEATETASGDAVASDPDAMRDILTVLRIRTGHDFSNYKPGTIHRRVDRRVHVRGHDSLSDYARTIKENPDEAIALMKELLISVTNFFRDAPVFEVLAQRVIPRLFANKSGSDQIRVWVPACATGEEAYSLAMLLAEFAAPVIDQPSIQVFATDLDEAAIAVAREAFYTEAEVADLSEERLQRFFNRETGGYRIKRDLREMVLFAHHNVIKDPPFSHLDLISCRNLLIYLNRSVQERVIETFHFALRPGGFLFLGASETPYGLNDLFVPSEKAAHVYESRGVSARVPLPLAEQAAPLIARMPARPAETRPATERVFPGDLHQQLLERYAPPSVVVTDEHNIVHMSEHAGRYMSLPGGEPTRDIVRLVRPELRAELRTALYQAVRGRATVRIDGVTTAFDDGTRRVDVTVHPVLRESEPPRGYLLVVFQESADTPRQQADAQVEPPEPLAQRIEEELGRVKAQLRSTIEQYETQVEEAKASNEELQAMNEELRSAAEELETSKEELQSVNEELTTVNQELKIKIEELALTNNDFQNLINASEIGTIFLDRNLRVKLSTPAATQVFNLQRTDVGRPLTDITTHLRYDGLYDDIRHVLDDLHAVQRELQTRDGRWMQMRIRPYRTLDDRIDGVVMTFQDTSERRAAEEQLRQNEERLRLLVEGASEYAIFTMGSEGVIDSWNPGAERMFGYRADEIVGRHVEVLFTTDDRVAGAPAQELEVAYQNGRSSDDRFHVRKDGTRFFCSGSTIRLGERLGFAKIARDLSVQQQAAEAIRVVEADFDARVRERTGHLEAEVQERAAAHHHVIDLLRKIVTAQEDERARIARDLHDQLGQQLTALRLSLQRQREAVPAESHSEDLDMALSLADRIDHDLDFLSWQLRPAVLDDVGLSAALPVFVREWSQHSRVPAEYQSGGISSGLLSPDAELVFYRVAQEALTNVAKHADASRVDVMLEARDGSVLLVVEDDGVGFDPADQHNRERGIGLAGMHERASLISASLQIESAPGEGTSIFLRCPAAAAADVVPVKMG
jgi:two-component system CheB/CheR fusion protein